MSFEYFKPESLEDALRVYQEAGEEAEILAGGTAVNLLIGQRLLSPTALIDLANIQELRGIRLDGERLRIGAMTRLTDIVSSELVQKYAPGLASACAVVGNVRVRHQATLGGNLVEADYASDPPAMLLALDAAVVLMGPDTKRELPLASFLQGFYLTAIEPHEILTEIVIPVRGENVRMAYRKFKTRSAEDRPALGIAVVVNIEDGVCRQLRLSVGAAVETPRRFPEVEAVAEGLPLEKDLIKMIADSYAEGIEPLDDLRASAWYRREMIRVEIQRALGDIHDGRR